MVITAGATLCIANPAFAAKIPFIGKIFEEAENNIPFSVDTESAKEDALNVSGSGYTIQKVFVSPYQVVSYVDVPFTED